MPFHLFFSLTAISFFNEIYANDLITRNDEKNGGVRADTAWTYADHHLSLNWQLVSDQAVVKVAGSGSVVWQGSLLPSFWIKAENGQSYFLKPKVISSPEVTDPDKLVLELRWENFGTGSLTVEKKSWGLSFSELKVNWNDKAPAIIEMYIGASKVPENNNVKPTWDRPFMPDWQSFGYCVPGAKGGTVQSCFRSWDLGHATVALGNFGPAMGSPYGAAFPRPVLYAAMGSDAGWITIGAGSIPDAALSLRIQSTLGCFQYLYREDLWGAIPVKTRVWNDLLRITLDSTARGSFEKYYASFNTQRQKKQPAPQFSTTSIWNTWGMWRNRKYPIRPIADFMQKMHNNIMVLDDPWESSQGSGKPDLKRFPDFYKDLDYIRSKHVEVGVWETIGWVKDTVACGLGSQDLILDKNGKPCMANWNFSPSGDAYYCLDVSSERTRAFLRERTIRIMQEIKPKLIKLDFGYGLPGPDMGAPKNPAYRGEKHSFELMKLISEAAKSVDPQVVMMGYSISPLWSPVTDLVSLDDQGDLWYDLEKGHQEWSVWASLLGKSGTAISGSSCYDWTLDNGILLNSLILGSPGAVLPSEMDNGSKVPDEYMNRRLAVNLWHRKTRSWEPAWFDSNTGSMHAPPQLKSWGRIEEIDSQRLLTAMVLRANGNSKSIGINKLSWSGTWAVVAQDDKSVQNSERFAIIPFSAGEISFPCLKKPASVTFQNIHRAAPFTNWKWESGLLKIRVSEDQFKDTAGFLVEFK